MNHQVSHRLIPLIVFTLWMTTLVGIRSIPIERHGIFVSATAQEMQTSGNWIVPRFNGAPRLQKPPLSYWATALVSKLDWVHSDVQIWHGRLVSLLAALLLGLATLHMGGELYDRKTGFLAGLFFVGMLETLDTGHNARPDMLYACLCVSQLFAWMKAWRGVDGSKAQYIHSLLGWLAAALATLAKGPQTPLVFLIGALIFLLTGPDRKRVFRILRPASGSIVFCAIVLPWWVLLNRQLDALGVNISDSQMSGSLLRNLANWKELLSGFYLWRLALCMLPISLVIPFLIPRLWEKRRETNEVNRMLLTVSATWLIVFSLGGHYRSHYLLALLPIGALLLARTITVVPPAALPKKWWRVLLLCFSAGILGVVGLLLYQKNPIALLGLCATGTLLFTLLRIEFKSTDWDADSFLKQLVVLSVLATIVFAGGNASLPLHPSRTAEQSFSKRVLDTLELDDLVVAWKTSTDPLFFYRKTPIPSFREQDALAAYIESESAKNKPVFVLLRTRELEKFSATFDTEIIAAVKIPWKPKNELTLLRIISEKAGPDTNLRLGMEVCP